MQTDQEILKTLNDIKIQKRINNLAKKYSGKKIFIYGAGRSFHLIKENFDISKLEIAGVVDKKFDDNEEYLGYKTFSSKTFMEEKPDIVLLSVMEPDTIIDYFEDMLFETYGKFKYDLLIKIPFFQLLKKLFTD